MILGGIIGTQIIIMKITIGMAINHLDLLIKCQDKK